MATRKLFVLSTVLSSLSIATAEANTRFQQFFPVYRETLIQIRNEDCAALWEKQRTEPYYTVDETCPALLSCIMERTSEAIKGNFSSGLVALGLMPTILTFLGSAVSETALLSKRRPILALLIACGSPAVNPLPTFVYDNPLESLTSIEGRLLPQRLLNLSYVQAFCIVLVEYLLVLGACANVLAASYYVGLWTINTISCDDTWYALLWVLLTIIIHGLGMVALDQRVRVHTTQNMISHSDRLKWLKHEFTPCIIQEKIQLEWKDESYLFVLVSWMSSVGTVTHLLFGTIAFSSITFIGYIDSIKIIARFMASAVVCRSVLMFELAGMRNASSVRSGL